MAQKGSASSISSVQTFENREPSKSMSSVAPTFYVPNLSESAGKIVLGNIVSGEKEAHQLKIRLEDIKRHVTILGMTGSGKTTTSALLTYQVASIGLPVLVLDWHNEYRKVVAGVGGKVFSPGMDDFVLNPLQLYSSEQTEHVAIITDIFSDIYHFSHPQAYMFRNALQKCITESSDEPTLEDLIRIIEAYPLRSAYDNETKVALLRRLVPLTQGQVGKAMNGPSSLSFEEILSSVVCVELGHLRDMQTRSIFTEIMLKILYEFRTRASENIEHLTVVEEARNIAPARRDEEPPSVGERMVSELRKFGESMVFVAQFPTQLASEIIKNSAVRIVHRIAWHEDMEIVANSIGLNQNQKEHLGMLDVGEAVVSLARLPRPILVRIREHGYQESKSLSFSALS
jgi:DNA helicase HerA-like ATPase